MPASGPVYQPTTVSYEQQNEWSLQPRSYLAQTVNRVQIPRCVQWSLLAVAFVSIAIGFILFVEGAISSDSHEPPATFSVQDGGFIMIIIGIMLLVAYVRLVLRKGWPCFKNKDPRLARELDSQASNGQILTLNPSTDLLVTSQQYSTVHEAPPTLSEEEETRKLMGNDNKDGTEENERMLETDPRIVLRPSSNPEEA